MRRLDPCTCGSGVRYKHCHGHPDKLRQVELAVNQMLAEHQADEDLYGLGQKLQPIVFQGSRVVLIGNSVWQAAENSTTFDLFESYLKQRIGLPWFSEREEKQHPLKGWLHVLESARRSGLTVNLPGKTGTSTLFALPGPAVAFLRLGYDLVTIDLNVGNIASPERLNAVLSRLKTNSGFVSARQELQAAAIFLKAGYHLEWEDEQDGTSHHAEFTATWPHTGKKFSVECRMKQPQDMGPVVKRWTTFNRLFTDALRKNLPHERIVCIDINTPALASTEAGDAKMRAAVAAIRSLERDPIHSSLPPALVLFIHFPERHQHDVQPIQQSATFCAFKLPPSAFVGSEFQALAHSMRTHSNVPDRFQAKDESPFAGISGLKVKP